MSQWAKRQVIDDEIKVIHKMRKHVAASLYDMITDSDYLQDGLVDVDKFHKHVLCARDAVELINKLVEFQLDDKWKKTLDT